MAAVARSDQMHVQGCDEECLDKMDPAKGLLISNSIVGEVAVGCREL